MHLILPKHFDRKGAHIQNNVLYITENVASFESIMFELSYAIFGNTCFYCGTPLKMYNRTIDHVYAKSIGGISITDNLVPCCAYCNSQKSSFTVSEYDLLQSLTSSKLKRERKKFITMVSHKNNYMFKLKGFILPDEWVKIIPLEKVGSILTKSFTKGKKYFQYEYFFENYKNLPRPIIVDRNFRLLDGLNILILAKDKGLLEIPAVVCENVSFDI